ncbi:TetR/AcrR family transcriptional regulator [Ammonicoccus fulvus]|uniref:TetR/AcrR family transcriptional regulator n=1 Tax=Ammonicoccus fulvus TaxID=3138240 RepID=A0ABZ3FM69_9ACTN
MSVTSRRRQRHEATLDEIVDHAVAILSTEGVAGLSLGEIARRLGMRTQSLYTYVDSKAALFDELFRRGWEKNFEAIDAAMAAERALGPDTDTGAYMLAGLEANIRWILDHPGLAQLMLFRPVPTWEPTAEAYAASVRVFSLLNDELATLRQQGRLRTDIPLDEMAQGLANIGAGVISRQLGNNPGVRYDDGTAPREFRALFRALLATYLPEE